MRLAKPAQVFLGALAVATVPLLWLGNAFAGIPVPPAPSAPELDPGTASSGIALAAVAGILLLERYRAR